MVRALRAMFYVIFAVFGGLSGYSLARQTYPLFQDALPTRMVYANFAAMILCGILLGITVAPWLARLLVYLVDRIAVSLQALPLQEVLMGSIGLLFGLIIAFFVNLAVQQVRFSAIPVVGDFLGPLLVLISTVFLGTLGAYFGSRMVFIHSLRQLLESGGAAGGGARRLILLDTSVAVDGRIADIRETGFLDGLLVVPRFVLEELQRLADSEDPLKRNRGRRGLDVLNAMRRAHGIQVSDRNYEDRGVDGKLLRLALETRACLCTNDFNLAKVAALQGISVLNINELSQALRPVFLPGEELVLKIVREGRESGQGIGYLPDGAMVVVEDGRRWIGAVCRVEVTSVVQTASGRMFFGRSRGAVPSGQGAGKGEAGGEDPGPGQAAVPEGGG